MVVGLLWRFGPWLALALAGLVIWGLWGRLEAAGIKLAAAEAVIETKEQDQRRSAEAVKALAERIASTEVKVVHAERIIHAAPVTRECAQSPAMRAAGQGIRELLQEPRK